MGNLIAQWRGRRFDGTNMAVGPGDAGSHDIPFDQTSVAASYQRNPVIWSDNASGTESRLRALKFTPRTGTTDGTPIQLLDAGSQTANITWNFEKYNPGVETLSTYSIRGYMAIDYDQSQREDIHNTWFTFYNDGVWVWSIKTDGYTTATGTTNRPFIDYPSSPKTRGTGQLYGTGFSEYYRFEIQVSETATPKVKARIYSNDSTTIYGQVEANPPSVTVSSVTLGDMLTDHGFLVPGCNMRIADFEMWDDYDLNGEFVANAGTTTGTPYKPQTVQILEVTGPNTFSDLEFIGVISELKPGRKVEFGYPSSLDMAEHTGILATDLSYVRHELSYGTGSTRVVDLYVPSGTPPSGGWPTIVWVHPGYFLGGTYRQNVLPLAKNIMQLGCAFASVEYATAQLTTGAYPSWNPSAATGRYPSFQLQFKEATAYLKANAATYGLNVNRFIASGSSAGGHVAFAAVAGRGVTNDGTGRDLTLAGNTSTFGCPNVPDPTWHAGFFWCPVINMDALVEYDPTAPVYAFWIQNTVPVMRGTAAAMMGRNYNNSNYSTYGTGVDYLIRVNAANLPKYIGYCWAGSDWLVGTNKDGRIPDTQDQRLLLLDAISDSSATLPTGFEFDDICIEDAIHETVTITDMDWARFKSWLNKVLA